MTAMAITMHGALTGDLPKTSSTWLTISTGDDVCNHGHQPVLMYAAGCDTASLFMYISFPRETRSSHQQ